MPDVKPGNTEGKLAFASVIDLGNDFNLEQIVDKSTREENILNLVFTDDAEILSECQSIVTQPLPLRCRPPLFKLKAKILELSTIDILRSLIFIFKCDMVNDAFP